MNQQKNKFFLQFDDDACEQQKNYQSPQKNDIFFNNQSKKFNDDKDKYSGDKIGKGYFNKNDQEDYIGVINLQKKSNMIQQLQLIEDKSKHKRRSKRNQKLQPLTSNHKIQSKSIILGNKVQKKQDQQKNIFDYNIDQDVQDIEQIKLQNQHQDIKEKRYIFQKNQVEQYDNNISQTKSDQNYQLLQIEANIKNKFLSSNVQSNNLNKQSNLLLVNNFSGSDQIKQFILKQLPYQKTFRLTLIREKGLFQIHPTYNIYTSHENKYLMTAKKTSNSLIATHHFSINQNEMQQNGQAYVGKVKANLTNSLHNIYSPGLSPQNAKQNNGPQREIVATVTYLTEIFSGGSKPRQLRVFVKKSDVSYFELTGVNPFQQQKSLVQLYPVNKNKILIFRNKRPVWKQSIKGYSLNFHGRVTQPSIKNFILETNSQQLQGQQVLLFGRVGDDKFNMDVSHPLSLNIALGIVITTFGAV